MQSTDRTPPADKPGAPNKSASKPTRAKSTRSQIARVQRMLTAGWVCGVGFLTPGDGLPPILRAGARMHELRRDGWLIDRRRCQAPWHDHDAQMWEWRIVGHIRDGRLPGIG